MPKLPLAAQNARRAHILDAAQRCFIQAGFHRATMSDICKEAGVSPGALYNYFPSKEALIAGLCERECATFAALLAAKGDETDVVGALNGIADQCAFMQAPEKLRLHFDIAAEAARNPAIAETVRASDAFVIESFVEFFARARDAGRIDPVCDVRIAAQILLMVGNGMFLYRSQNTDFDPLSIRPALDRIVKALLNPPASPPETIATDTGPESRNRGMKEMKRSPSNPVVSGLAACGLSLFGAVTAHAQTPQTPQEPAPAAQAPAVTVTAARYESFTDTVMVTGSLVAREEVLVGPEIDGLRIIELLAEEGDEVKKGQTLARLSHDALEAQLAQNAAAIARASAGVEQARLTITDVEAQESQASADFDRADKLRQSGNTSEAVFGQRQAAARSVKARLASAKRGLTFAEAEKTQLQAQRRELEIRMEQTEIKAPAAGVVSRRAARLGALASGAGEPLFRIVARGEIELDGEVAEAHLPRLAGGMTARVEISGLGERTGRIRLIMPEVEKATRLGRVRIFLGADRSLHIGGFARAVIETASSKGIAVPAGAVLYGSEGPLVQVVRDERVESRLVRTGLSSSETVEIRSGLAEGETVVARAGAFLRDGDAVRPVMLGQTTLSAAPPSGTRSEQR